MHEIDQWIAAEITGDAEYRAVARAVSAFHFRRYLIEDPPPVKRDGPGALDLHNITVVTPGPASNCARYNGNGRKRYPPMTMTVEEILEHRAKGMQQAAIAELAGCPSSRISKILTKAGITPQRRVSRPKAVAAC